MSLAPISQVAAVGVAGAAVGTAGRAVGSFAKLLGAALGAGQRGAGESRDGSAGQPATVHPASPGAAVARMASLRDTAEGLRSQFIAEFRALLAANGIDAGPEVHLGFDDFGNVRVIGPHPEAASIDHALATDAGLGHLFQRLAAVTQTLAAAEAGGSAAADPLFLPDAGGFRNGGNLQEFVLTISSEPPAVFA